MSDTRMAHDEYLRRNLLVASAIGAQAAATTALTRLHKMKRPPKWLIDAFMAVDVRTMNLPADLAQWRDTAPDKP